MTTKIGGVVIDIDARLAKLETSLAKGQNDLKRFERNAMKSSSAIEKHVAGIGASFKAMGATIAALGVGAIAGAGKSILDFADDLATAADQAGISIERYQTLKEGLRSLEISGVAVDKSLKALNDTLGSVQAGTVSKELGEALDRLGVSQKIYNGEIANSGELLDGIAAGSRNYATAAQFTTDVVTIFGRKVGVDMAAALKDGGAALRQLETDFRNTGNVISTEMAQKLANANEAIDRFKTNSQQTLTIWAGESLDYFGRVWDGLTRLELKYRNFLGADTGDLQSRISGYMQGQATPAGIRAQMEWVKSAQEQYDLAQKIAGKLGGGGFFGRQAVGTAGNALKEETDRLNELVRLYQSLNKGPAASGARPTFSPPPASSGGGKSKTGKPEEDPIAEMLKAVDIDIRNMPESISGSSDDRWKDQLDAAKKNVIELSEFRRQEDERLAQFEAQQIQSLANLYEDAFRGGVGAIWKDFKDIGLAVVSQVLAKFVVSNLGGGGGGFDLGSAFSSAIGGILGFASGGRPPVGRASMVGERGPELFIPDQAGTVIPNHMLGVNDNVARGGGASVVNQTITFSGAVDLATREEVYRIAEAARLAAMRGVAEHGRRRA